MATERLLKHTLTLYHDIPTRLPHAQDAAMQQVLGSTASLLTSLSNPLNISLLVSQFLTAPAVWSALERPDVDPETAATTCFRAISMFNTAAIHVHRHDREERAAARHGLIGAAAYRLGVREDRRPDAEDWARAVAAGADARSPRWRHVLVLVGVLLGLAGDGRHALSHTRRAALEQGVVAAANLALSDTAKDKNAPPTAQYAVVAGLNFAFPLLAEHARQSLDSDRLLGAAVACLAGPFGFDGARVLQQMATDPQARTVGGRIEWPAAAASFQALRTRETSNAVSLVAGAGPVAAMAAFAVERAVQPQSVVAALDALVVFADTAAQRWTACRLLSDLDLSGDSGDSASFLTPATATATWPLLWQHLKKTLFAVATVLQAIIGRTLVDAVLASDAIAPTVASNTLRVLRALDFIAAYDSSGAFQAHRFAYLAAIDVLARYPDAAAALLAQLASAPTPTPTSAPLRLAADLWYLNLAEHFASVLPPSACEGLLVQPALPYIASTTTLTPTPLTTSPRRVAVFEAAHSAVLAVLACPHNARIAAALAPFYADALLASFPARVSARQFRLAFKTLVQILSPPCPVFATHPDLAETLLEMVRFRAATATSTVLAPAHGHAHADTNADTDADEPVSEQSALVLTLVDALPFLALPVLEHWLTTAAETLWAVRDPVLRTAVQRRFWDVLGSGEMDVERAAIGVAWWGNRGGGALVMHGRRTPSSLSSLPSLPSLSLSLSDGDDAPMMTGALPHTQSRL